MRYWFSRNSDVPIREQLVTQVILGILSGELEVGQRLPSTRDFARRFHLHANTVSGAYRELEELRWVQSRKGSGVYVSKRKPAHNGTPEAELDRRIAEVFAFARDQMIPSQTLRARLEMWISRQPPDHFLVVEPDSELRRIVEEEIRSVVDFRIEGCDFDACRDPRNTSGAIVVMLPSKADAVKQLLPPSAPSLVLGVRSVTAPLAQWIPARPDALVVVASRWGDFLKAGRTMLTAAGLAPDALMFVDARERGWKRCLDSATVVVCDSVVARELPKSCRALVFTLLSDAAKEDLRSQEMLARSID